MDIFLERGGGGKNVTYDLQGSNLHFFGHPPSLKNTSFGTAGVVPTYIFRGTRGPPKNVTYIFSRPPLILRVKGVGMLWAHWAPYKWPKINGFHWGYFTLLVGPGYNLPHL